MLAHWMKMVTIPQLGIHWGMPIMSKFGLIIKWHVKNFKGH